MLARFQTVWVPSGCDGLTWNKENCFWWKSEAVGVWPFTWLLSGRNLSVVGGEDGTMRELCGAMLPFWQARNLVDCILRGVG